MNVSSIIDRNMVKRGASMTLLERIEKYEPVNEQERIDKKVILNFIKNHTDCFNRDNLIGHMTCSIWTVNKARTKTLMVYHNIYDSWSWIGGHADGIENLSEVAMRELQEETGVKHARLVSDEIFSIEVLPVSGHEKKGKYVPSHLHLNITYLAEADEEEVLIVNVDENKGVKWFTFEEALKVSNEPWFVERIYKKLIEKVRTIDHGAK